MTLIEVKNLVKKYGNNVAVDNLSFTVEEGQIYGFLGPNGAGKSTTMNIITGYIASTSGQVLVNGHDILEEPEAAKKNIGYLPEIPPLYMDMTVLEYLTFVAELKKIAKTEKNKMIQEIMNLVKIDDMCNRLIKNLSKGYRQRVGLAQALIGYPEVIILDEPTVGLDPKQIIEIRDLIKSLGKKHTIILSSHILSEVSAVCDYVMIISHGKLVASDSTENLGKLALKENTLEVTVKGTKEDAEDVLMNMEILSDQEYSVTQRQNESDLIIKTKENIDVRENLFYELARRNMPIMKMIVNSKSLEDVFLKLTDTSEKKTQNNLIEDDNDINAELNKKVNLEPKTKEELVEIEFVKENKLDESEDI